MPCPSPPFPCALRELVEKTQTNKKTNTNRHFPLLFLFSPLVSSIFVQASLLNSHLHPPCFDLVFLSPINPLSFHDLWVALSLSLSLLLCFMGFFSGGSLESSNSSSSSSNTRLLMNGNSFTYLLNSGSNDKPSRSFSDRIADRSGSGVPKFKSLPPPSLPISPPSLSPSSYFAIPPGLSPAELLDSPVLLSSSNVSLSLSPPRFL